MWLQKEWDRKGGCSRDHWEGKSEIQKKGEENGGVFLRDSAEGGDIGGAVERVRGFSMIVWEGFLSRAPTKYETVSWKPQIFSIKGISRYVYQSSISFIDIWMLSDLFGVDVKGHLFVCWDITMCLCLLLWI